MLTRYLMLIPAAALALAAGCAETQQPTGTPVLVDPTKTRSESGGTDDILQVCQTMLDSMRRNQELEAKGQKLVLLDDVRVDPKLRGYNPRMLYNEFVAKLNRLAPQDYRFLDRQAVNPERQRQLSGEVKTSGIDRAAAGADFVLSIELISMQGASDNTVQYTFRLTNLN